MTESARQKRKKLPNRQAYLCHRATSPTERQASGLIKRNLLPATPWGLNLQEIELPLGAETGSYGETDQEIIWQILAGAGLMNLGDDQFAVIPGDVIYIRPTTAHHIRSMANTPLRINCITNQPRFPSP
ncbi:MAG: cupin domain-containing protein [Halothiobacillus sp.]